MRLGVKFNWSEWVNLSEPSGELNAGRLSCLDGALAFLLRKKRCRHYFCGIPFVFSRSESHKIGGRTWNRTGPHSAPTRGFSILAPGATSRCLDSQSLTGLYGQLALTRQKHTIEHIPSDLAR